MRPVLKTILLQKEVWNNYPVERNLTDLVADLHGAEQRIARGVNLQLEIKRRARIRARIDDLALAAIGRPGSEVFVSRGADAEAAITFIDYGAYFADLQPEPAATPPPSRFMQIVLKMNSQLFGGEPYTPASESKKIGPTEFRKYLQNTIHVPGDALKIQRSIYETMAKCSEGAITSFFALHPQLSRSSFDQLIAQRRKMFHRPSEEWGAIDVLTTEWSEENG
jgi:hypothetical protein